MTTTIERNARAVLLPAFDGLQLSDAVKRCLDEGGVSILIGESREEYVERRMSERRRREETAEAFQALVAEAKARSGALLAAVDQEMAGICRLHGLVPPFPSREALQSMPEAELQALAREIAVGARDLGVNVFLAPILDVLTGPNPWLAGRTSSDDPATVARLSAAYIRGVQAGGVAATGKHFPGFGATTGDPAVDAEAVNPLPAAEIERAQGTFRAAVAAGVEMMMVGPTVVAAIDPAAAALRSPAVVRRLRDDLGFRGVVMADDLDGQATLRGDSVSTVAVEALAAGCDFLLLADTGEQLGEVAEAICAATRAGRLSEEALAASADRVRGLCGRYDRGGEP